VIIGGRGKRETEVILSGADKGIRPRPHRFSVLDRKAKQSAPAEKNEARTSERGEEDARRSLEEKRRKQDEKIKRPPDVGSPTHSSEARRSKGKGGRHPPRTKRRSEKKSRQKPTSNKEAARGSPPDEQAIRRRWLTPEEAVPESLE